jgi:hypothetical protein
MCERNHFSILHSTTLGMTELRWAYKITNNLHFTVRMTNMISLKQRQSCPHT